MRRFFRKLKLSKKKIVTISLVVLVFVMSLGYAALSQYMDIEGLAMIDRSWIIKVVDVQSVTTGNGADKSNNYVSSTVTMNAELPDSSSTVTYTIILENQGNLKARLSNIDRIEDDNTGITYSITGVAEGETTLNPGETNTVTVTIKYADSVTNVGNTKKSLMLTFNYVEVGSSNSSGGSTSTDTSETYRVFKVGQKVELLDESSWYVTKYSDSSEEYVTLLSASVTNDSICYDDCGSGFIDYELGDADVGYYFIRNYIEEDYLPSLKSSLINSDGDARGLTARLFTYEEYENIVASGKTEALTIGDTWTMTPKEDEDVTIYYLENGTMITRNLIAGESGSVRPVIIVKKSNVVDNSLSAVLLKNNTAQSDSNIDFGISSEEDGTNGLYYTADNTEDDGTTYYFRGNVDNNYVSFVDFSNVSGSCVYNGTKLAYGGSNELISSEEECNEAFVCITDQNSYVASPTSNSCGDIDGGTIIDERPTWVSETTIEKMTWRIVRINEDGSIRLIKQDIDNDYAYFFYNDTSDNAGVGYMYGQTGATGENAYALTHANTHDSIIKGALDTWYLSNLSQYSELLADAGFCNDRSIASTASSWVSDDSALGYSSNVTYYGSYNRLVNLKKPQFACPQTKDLFTTETSSKGNNALTYPIGLLTIDEAVYAGASVGYTSNYYLDSGNTFDGWWTMSPRNFDGNVERMWIGRISGDGIGDHYAESGIRPVINLKSNVEFTLEGTGEPGTSTNPYVIITD